MAVVHHTMKQATTPLWQRKELLPMDDYEFQQWAELLAVRTGIHLPVKRKTFLLTSLNIRMRELDINSYRQYFEYLIAGRRGAIEWEILIDRLTVHETRFFRDENALQMIREVFLPHLLKTQNPLNLNVWSVGCATGEEPYSLAMLLDYELSQKGREYYLSIMATDISAASLATARKGIFHENRLKNMPDSYRRMYCQAVDDTHYEVSAALRQRICFSRLNLLDLEKARIGQMDIIFCQNVLIYFKREQRLKFLNLLAGHLQPGGVLVLGAGEITDWHFPGIKMMNFPGILAFQNTASTGSKK